MEPVFSVSELISAVNTIFSSVGVVKVRGEIVEVSSHPKGYCFFVIKDPQTKEHTLDCFVDRITYDSFRPLIEVGLEVILKVSLSVYKTGRFRLIVQEVEPYGEGALKKYFEALKKKLAAKGYFDAERKKPLPEFIQKIGLITSESGAAIKDFLKNLGDYGFEIYFIDVRVEGDYAEDSIVAAIEWFNKNMPHLDVLVLVRGGGGLEELKAFNSEKVAEAIVLSRLPVVSGIGHERDETIADYCADLSFSTPSLVAAFLRKQREEFIGKIEEKATELIFQVTELLEEKNSFLLEKEREIQSIFSNILEKKKLVLAKITEQLHNHLKGIFEKFHFLTQSFYRSFYDFENLLKSYSWQVRRAFEKSLNLVKITIEVEKSNLKRLETALISLNPEAILKRGYSIVYRQDKKVIREASEVKKGEKIKIRLYKGKIFSKVEKLEG